jgi:glycosyltransferase involved in cell wall biosynthesis
MSVGMRKRKVAIVTFAFSSDAPGGVSTVVIQIVRILASKCQFETTIFSVANTKDARRIFGRSRNRDLHEDHKSAFGDTKLFQKSMFENCRVYEIKPYASEFEFMRYRKQRQLTGLFESYDLVIVVTGFLQFANVIPKLKTQVLVQCATRLKWERKSQYPSMSFLKKALLIAQIPILAFQEWRVLKTNVVFLPENTKMLDWLTPRSKSIPEKWYPPVAPSSPELLDDVSRSKHFVSVGRFGDRRKGWERLFDSYVKAFKLDPDLPRLVAIGWGDFPSPLKEKIDILKIEFPIEVLSNLPNEVRDQYLSSASFFIQASFEEGLGLAALEALRFGTPIICSETDGSREYVLEGISGFLVPQGKEFEKLFSEKLVQSQQYSLTELRESSKAFFDNTFSEQNSTKRFLEVVSRITR